jgi:hypothetical protein
VESGFQPNKTVPDPVHGSSLDGRLTAGGLGTVARPGWRDLLVCESLVAPVGGASRGSRWALRARDAGEDARSMAQAGAGFFCYKAGMQRFAEVTDGAASSASVWANVIR